MGAFVWTTEWIGAVFRDQTDHEDLIRRLEALIPETLTRCYAWVLMSNHAHFLLPQWSVPPGEGSGLPRTMAF